MSTLSGVMAARAAAARARRTVETDSLGAVELEALAPRDFSALARRGERAVLYAACRALQRAGDELFRAGKVYRPEEVTALLTDEEASLLAREVRMLSGLGQSSREETEEKAEGSGQASPEEHGERAGERAEQFGQSSREDAGDEAEGFGQSSREDKDEDGERFRPVFVRGEETIDKFRHPFVQEKSAENRRGRAREDALQPVREGADEKPQNMVVFPANEPSEVAVFSEKEENPNREKLEQMSEKRTQKTASGAEDLHEIKSEFRENLHETKSEFGGGLHEIKSEFDAAPRRAAAAVTEETAEEFARALLGGLRRAAWVR